jgi:mRNA interferase MazF
VVIRRGDVYWADLGEPKGSRPAKNRPVVVIQSQRYNDSRLRTAVVAAITSNTALAGRPGNVFVPEATSGLPKDSVVNITSLATVDKQELGTPIGHLPDYLMHEVDLGLHRILGL